MLTPHLSCCFLKHRVLTQNQTIVFTINITPIAPAQHNIQYPFRVMQRSCKGSTTNHLFKTKFVCWQGGFTCQLYAHLSSQFLRSHLVKATNGE